MPRKGERKCHGCGTFFDPEYDSSYYSRSGELYCYGCYESAESSASTVVAILPQTEAGDVDNETLYSEVIVTKFDDDFTFYALVDDEICEVDEDSYPDPIAGQHYVRTDAWRGYADFTWLEGFEVVESGWATGFPDETTRRKADLGELFEALRTHELEPPVALYWVFGQTSNIFSVACDIVVKSEDRAQLDAWLEECAGTSAEELHYQLG